MVSLLFINLVIRCHRLALRIYVFSALINKVHDKEASRYFDNNLRQHMLTGIKDRKRKAELRLSRGRTDKTRN